tara:strand:- start:899 stop:1486 length:588 start_codon:yes stop_codon:yes gene_type:complete
MTLSPYGYNEVCQEFSYIKGPIKVYKPWERPQEVRFKAWCKDIEEYIIQNKIDIEIYVCGKYLEDKEKTWDIDIIATKKDDPTDSELIKIRDLMIYSMNLGHDKYKMLIDMQYYYYNEKINNFWYSSSMFKKYGLITSTILEVYNKVYKNNQLLYNNNGEELMNDLYKVELKSPSEKHIKRLSKGIYYKEPIRII